MGSRVTRATLFSKGSPPPLSGVHSPRPSMLSLLSQHKLCECIRPLDFTILHLLQENSYSFFKPHQKPSSTRKPFLPAYLTPLLQQGLLLRSGTELPTQARRTDK